MAPPAGFEPALPPPEGGALSPELRGLEAARGYQLVRPKPASPEGTGSLHDGSRGRLRDVPESGAVVGDRQWKAAGIGSVRELVTNVQRNEVPRRGRGRGDLPVDRAAELDRAAADRRPAGGRLPDARPLATPSTQASWAQGARPLRASRLPVWTRR